LRYVSKITSIAIYRALEKTFSKVGQISLPTHFEAILRLFFLSVVEEFLWYFIGNLVSNYYFIEEVIKNNLFKKSPREKVILIYFEELFIKLILLSNLFY
jgi:hypothetical protein